MLLSVLLSATFLSTVQPVPKVTHLADDEHERLQIICIRSPWEYCKNKPVGFKFNDGCRECQCKRDDVYCKTPECVHFVKVNTPPEEYCFDILRRNEKQNAGKRARFIDGVSNDLLPDEANPRRELIVKSNALETGSANRPHDMVAPFAAEVKEDNADSVVADISFGTEEVEVTNHSDSYPMPTAKPSTPLHMPHLPGGDLKDTEGNPVLRSSHNRPSAVMWHAPPAPAEETRPVQDRVPKYSKTVLSSARSHNGSVSSNHTQKYDSDDYVPVKAVNWKHHGGVQSTTNEEVSGKLGQSQSHLNEQHSTQSHTSIVKTSKSTTKELLAKMIYDQLLQNKKKPTAKEEDKVSNEKNAQSMNGILKLLISFFSPKTPRQNESQSIGPEVKGRPLMGHHNFGPPHSQVVRDPRHAHIFREGPPDGLPPFIGESDPHRRIFGPHKADMFTGKKDVMIPPHMGPLELFEFQDGRQPGPMGPPGSEHGYGARDFGPLDDKPHWDGGSYNDAPSHFHAPEWSQPFGMFQESPDFPHEEVNFPQLHHVRGTSHSFGIESNGSKTSEAKVVSISEHDSTPSASIPLEIAPDTVMESHIPHIREKSNIFATPANKLFAVNGGHGENLLTGSVGNSLMGKSAQQNQALPIELTLRLDALQREVSSLRYQHQKCESYRKRIRHALKSYVFGDNNSASSHGSLVNNVIFTIVGNYILLELA